MKKDVTEYSSGSKFLHWLIALIVIVMLTATFFFDDLPKSMRSFAFMMHKSFGITVLFLMFLRLYWIHRSGKPALPATVPAWQAFSARAVHYALYLLLIIMPITGWVMSVAGNRIPSYFGLFDLPLPWIEPDKPLAKLMNQSHKLLAWVMIGFVVLHIAAAIKHWLFNKDKVFQTMWPGHAKKD